MALQPGLVALVLLAAVIHAAWNALAKGSNDRLAAMVLILGVPMLAGLSAIPFLPYPRAESWPFLIASVLFHTAYYYLLMNSYRFGDLGQVYPLARGSAPLLIVLMTAVTGVEIPTVWGLVGIGLVSVGIASLAFDKTARSRNGSKPVYLALATGLSIALYTFCDGLGTRSAGTPFAYIAWLFFLSGIPFCAATAIVRRRSLAGDIRASWKSGVPAGTLSALAYAVVLYALSLNPMAYISALRETSVLFAALIGTFVMKESFGGRRIAAAAIIAGGIMTMQIAG
jgi:drug/metabolite transporter (DMT)-like permease